MPTELAHQIIDDLRVWDVLQLLSHDNDRVDACIMSHPFCGRLFVANPEALSEWKFATFVYKDILTAVGKPMLGPVNIGVNPLGNNILVLAKWWKESHTLVVLKIEIMRHMQNRIRDELTVHWRKADLTRYGAKNHSQKHEDRPRDLKYCGEFVFEELKACWDDIQKAKANLSKLRASEIYWAADMLEENSDILKRTLDPEQKRRPNIAHIVSRMRRGADKILRAPVQKFLGVEHFRYDFLGVIPFDLALDQLLFMMQKHGMMDVDDGMATNKMSSANAVSHPSSILNSVRLVIDGMPRFYILPPDWPGQRDILAQRNSAIKDGDVLRTANTPWSEPFDATKQVSLPGPHFTALKYGTHKAFWRPKSLFYEPHHEMEKEWLISFVKVYRYLKDLDG
jgi:hypothetical protein